jgi:hypothetical protein
MPSRTFILCAANRVFEAALPPLPAGAYRCYADVTHETGLSRTLTAVADVPAASADATPDKTLLISDPDDSWWVPEGPPGVAGRPVPLGDGFTMIWELGGPLRRGRRLLRFRVLDSRRRAGDAGALHEHAGPCGRSAG